jgi:hypothetical protein
MEMLGDVETVVIPSRAEGERPADEMTKLE